MDDSAPRSQKVKLAIELEIDGGQRMLGHLFVSAQQRLPDLLNDAQTFLPFEGNDGLIKIIRKSIIRSVTPLGQVTLPTNSNDPYELLGVAPSISDEELKNVYHRRVQETHPDKLVSLGLPAEFVQLANDKVARINDAYDRICKHRQTRGDVGPKWYHGG
ncbi:MAG TPA: DnaJ domain-containing protein [Candidatus Acidoferrum sp.]|nr:DnaJ domain-containing protein [Candidatus Acidoferrum sp.]